MSDRLLAAQRTIWPLSLFQVTSLAVLVGFACLPWLSLPLPFADDLFYSGASFELVKRGMLANPLLRAQEFPSPFFFVYPPFYSYILAAWLAIFGINTLSLLYFQAVAYSLIALCFAKFLCRYGAPTWTPILTGLIVAFSLLNIGMRTDAVGLACFWLGILLFSLRQRWRLFFSLLFIELSIGISPRLMPSGLIFASGYALVVILTVSRDRAQGWQLARRTIWTALAAAVVLGIAFAIAIDFRWEEFWQTFSLHSRGRQPTTWPATWNYMVFVLFSVNYPMAAFWLATFAASPVIVVWAGNQRQRCWMAIATTSLVMGFAFRIVPIGFFLFLLSANLAIALFVLSQRLKLRTSLICFAFMLLLAAGPGKSILANRIVAWHQYHYYAHHADRLPFAATVFDPEALNLAARSRILIDPVAARYVFDYRLPSQGIDAMFSQPFPGDLALDLDDLQCGDLWLYSRLTKFAPRQPRQIVVVNRSMTLTFPEEIFITEKSCDSSARAQLMYTQRR